MSGCTYNNLASFEQHWENKDSSQCQILKLVTARTLLNIGAKLVKDAFYMLAYFMG